MKLRLFFLFILICNQVMGQTERYGVYFKAFPWTLLNDKNWVDTVTDQWGATGVELEVVWRIIEPNPPNPDHKYNWTQLDRALDVLIQNDVDISFRVRMGSLLPDWIDFKNSAYRAGKVPDTQNHSGIFDLQDFQIDHDGKHVFYTSTNDNANRCFNLCSPDGLTHMKVFLAAVVDHIHQYLVKKSYDFTKHRVLEFMPNINFDSELELRAGWVMTGYSKYEIEAFRSFLRELYHDDLTKLRKRWKKRGNEPVIRRWQNIQPAAYNWHEMQNMAFGDYDYPQGRIDWIKFRFHNLKEFVDDLAMIINKRGYRMGVQLGSITDSRIDFRGFLDPTELLRYAYSLRLADIRGYRDHFDFGADYARSICRFWEDQGSDILRGFSSETNGYGYGFDSKMNDKENSRALAADWVKQIRANYSRGSDRHLVIGWGNTEGASVVVKKGRQSMTIAQTDLVDDRDIQKWFLDFRKELQRLGKGVNPNKKNVPKQAIHISAAYFPFSPEIEARSTKTYTAFPLHEAVKAKESYRNKNLSDTNAQCDFITDFMITEDPTYLLNFDQVILSSSSEVMSEKIYNTLLKWTTRVDKLKLINATTLRSRNAREKIPGRKNEYNETRTPNLRNIE